MGYLKDVLKDKENVEKQELEDQCAERVDDVTFARNQAERSMNKAGRYLTAKRNDFALGGSSFQQVINAKADYKKKIEIFQDMDEEYNKAVGTKSK